MNAPLRLSLLAVLFLSAAQLCAQSEARITLDSHITYQTITGWEATSQSGQDFPAFRRYRDELFDKTVDQLGITRIRLEMRSGMEHRRDTWREYQTGAIDYATWRSIRYATVNDNPDPFVLDTSGFHFSQLDSTIERVILPLRQRLADRGGRLLINANYVAFTGQIGAGNDYNHDDSPEEYAEFVLAAYLHMQHRYGFVPDSWEIILEPDNTSFWRGRQIGLAIAAVARRLEANGFTPRFVTPSTTNMARAPEYFDSMIVVPGVLPYLQELSYHRYGGVSAAALDAISRRAVQYGVNTSMLEHIGSGYSDLHDDLTLGRNSAWQQFTLAWPGNNDDGGAYFRLDTNAAPGSMVTFGTRTKMFLQYFPYIRPGAIRIDASSSSATFSPVAFVNADGRQVLVVRAGAGGAFSVDGLAAGTYRITSRNASGVEGQRRDTTIRAGETLRATIGAAGVLTVAGVAGTVGIAESAEGATALDMGRPRYDPGTETLRVPIALGSGGVVAVDLITMDGRIPMHWTESRPVGAQMLQIPTGRVVPGLYLCRVSTISAGALTARSAPIVISE